jgi:hypothetical protein
MVIDKKERKNQTKGSNHDKLSDDFDDLDFDLDLDTDDLTSEFPELEDIDLDDESDEQKDGADLDNEDLSVSTKKLFKTIKQISSDDGQKSKASISGELSDIGISKESGFDSKLMTTLAVIELQVEEFNNLGLDISIIKDLIKEAKEFIEEKDYSSAKTLITNSKKLSANILIDHRMNLLSTIIAFIETFIFELTELELDFKLAEDYFGKAKKSLKEKDINSANKYIRDTLENVRKVLNATRTEKIEEALRFFNFWFDELSDKNIDKKKLKTILTDSKNSLDSSDLDTSEQILEKATYSSKAEVNKLDINVEQKEDYIQQLDGLYEFEDFSSLCDAQSRAMNMLNESLDKNNMQENLDALLKNYGALLDSRESLDDKSFSNLITKFKEAKESFEKKEYRSMAQQLEEIGTKVGIPIPSKKPKEIVVKERVVRKKLVEKGKVKPSTEIEKTIIDDSKQKLDEIPAKPSDEKPENDKVDDKDVVPDSDPEPETEPETQTESKKEIEPQVDYTELIKIRNEIKQVEVDVNDLNKKHIKIPEILKMLNELQKNYERNDITSNKNMLKNIKEKIKEVNDKFAEEELVKINKKIDELLKNIESAKLEDVQTDTTEDLINYAKQRLKSKKYSDVNEILLHAQDVLESARLEKQQNTLKDEALKIINENTKSFESITEESPYYNDFKELCSTAKSKFESKDYQAIIEMNVHFKDIVERLETHTSPTKQQIEQKPEITKRPDDDADKSIKTEDYVDITNKQPNIPETESIDINDRDIAMLDEDSKVEPIHEQDRPVNIDNSEEEQFKFSNSQELIKEAFGFKIKRDTDNISGQFNEDFGSIQGPENSQHTRLDDDEIQRIRDQMKSRINSKRKNGKSQRPLFPHEIRELEKNNQDYERINNKKDTRYNSNNAGYVDDDVYYQNGSSINGENNNIDEYEMEDKIIRNPPSKERTKPAFIHRSRNYSNNLKNGQYLGSVQQQKTAHRKMGHNQQRKDQIIINPTNQYSQQNMINNMNNVNGYDPRMQRQEMARYRLIDNVDVPQEQYDSRLSTLKKEALKGLQEIQSIISDTYYFGAVIEELERISEDARNAFDDRDYQEVLLYVDKCEELSRHLKLGYMERLIQDFKISGENTEYLEYLFNETETAYNEEKYKIGDELAKRFIAVTRDLEFEEKIVNQTWIYCRYCGNAIPRDSTFCSFCGDKLL